MGKFYISIRLKLVIFIVFLLILSTFTVTYVNISITKGLTLHIAENTLNVSFSKIRGEIKNWLSYVSREIEVYGSRETVISVFNNPSPEKKEALIGNLRILLTANPEFQDFFVSDVNGNIIVSTSPMPFTKFSPLSCEVINFESSVRTVIISHMKKKAVYTCLKNPSGLVKGYFVGVLNLNPLYDRLYSSIQELFKNMAWGISICSKDGEERFHYGVGGCHLNEIATGKGFIEDKDYVHGFYYESFLDSFVVISLKKSDIYGFYYREIKRLIFVTVFLILFASLLTNYLLKYMIKPIEDLVWGASRVAEGDLNIKLPIKTSDELGVLTEKFNAMVEKLREDKEELENANNELQQAYKKLESMNKTLTERNKELEIANAKLQVLSITDSLTGLFNHRFLQESLERELKLAKRAGYPLSYIMIDIDNFKIFNDTYGHQAGDALLSQLGKLIVANLRTSDIATRYGGEEFGIILPNTDRDGAVYLGEKLRMVIAHHPFKIQEHSKDIYAHITVSIGVSTKRPFVIGSHSREEIIKEADEALYYAKKAGKNRVVHYFDIMMKKKEN